MMIDMKLLESVCKKIPNLQFRYFGSFLYGRTESSCEFNIKWKVWLRLKVVTYAYLYDKSNPNLLATLVTMAGINSSQEYIIASSNSSNSLIRNRNSRITWQGTDGSCGLRVRNVIIIMR